MTRKAPSVFLTVDPALPEPVYEQIARQLRIQIASGRLAPGTLLPPVRTLASDLGYNLNTVARSYRMLEAEGFVVDVSREGNDWSGTVGRVPLAGCCMEPVKIGEPHEEVDGSWTVRAREGTLWGCGDDVTVLVLKPRSDGHYTAECGTHRETLAIAKPVSERLADWQKERVDKLFARVAAIKRDGTAWSYDGKPLVRCVTLAHKCNLAQLVASCELDDQHILRVRDGVTSVIAGSTPYEGAAQCVKGVLPGID